MYTFNYNGNVTHIININSNTCNYWCVSSNNVNINFMNKTFDEKDCVKSVKLTEVNECEMKGGKSLIVFPDRVYNEKYECWLDDIQTYFYAVDLDNNTYAKCKRDKEYWF